MNEHCTKVSVVVPVYNVPEDALRKCIESTIRQTLDEIEIILIDDGSTDDSGIICDEYAKKDNRVQVIHKQNGGLSAARNTGYKIATGEWVTFLDSDDWIEEDTCESTYRIGDSKKVDIVIFGTVQEFGHYKKPFTYHYKDGTIFYGDECKKLQCEILNFRGNIATAWAKLIRKTVLDDNHIEHNDELRQGSEGIEFNIRLFEKIQSAYFTDKVFYHYIYNPNSISAKHDEINHFYVIRCFEEIKVQIEKSNNKELLSGLFYDRFSYTLIATAISGYFSPNNPISFFQQKVSFKKYLNEKLIIDTLNKTDVKKLDVSRRIIFRLLKIHFFLPIKILAKMRYAQKNRG